MKVKMFYGYGADGIEVVETKINAWLSQHGERIDVLDTQITACQIAESGESERYECIVTAVWYTEGSGANLGAASAGQPANAGSGAGA